MLSLTGMTDPSRFAGDLEAGGLNSVQTEAVLSALLKVLDFSIYSILPYHNRISKIDSFLIAGEPEL